VLPPTGDAPDCRDRGGKARSSGCPENGSGNTGSNAVRGTTSVSRRPFRGPGVPSRGILPNFSRDKAFQRDYGLPRAGSRSTGSSGPGGVVRTDGLIHIGEHA